MNIFILHYLAAELQYANSLVTIPVYKHTAGRLPVPHQHCSAYSSIINHVLPFVYRTRYQVPGTSTNYPSWLSDGCAACLAERHRIRKWITAAWSEYLVPGTRTSNISLYDTCMLTALCMSRILARVTRIMDSIVIE